MSIYEDVGSTEVQRQEYEVDGIALSEALVQLKTEIDRT